MYLGDFKKDVKKFNEIYKIGSPSSPTDLGPSRLDNFHSILSEELREVHDVIKKLENKDPDGLVDLSDWLGDIIVYCASEATRWGLDISTILKIIMESNFSKLDESGNPIYDERGKVMKGPGYWKPEPKIKKELF